MSRLGFIWARLRSRRCRSCRPCFGGLVFLAGSPSVLRLQLGVGSGRADRGRCRTRDHLDDRGVAHEHAA